MPVCLLRERKMPRSLPTYVVWGGEDEAIASMDDYGGGWARTPHALDWLKERHSADRGHRS